MFGYYLDLALRSLKRTPILTGLMVLAIGLGIGASMTMLTVLHVMTDDPLPGRSSHLYVPHLNPLPLKGNFFANGYDPSDHLTWPDAMALLNAQSARRQSAMAAGHLLVRPSAVGMRSFYVDGRYTTADFFTMFGVPFERGSSWSAADDAAGAHVVVLADSLARKLFGGTDAVGKMVRMGENDLRVIGVTTNWQPSPLFYADSRTKRYSDRDLFFLPLSTAVDLNLGTDGNVDSWGKMPNGDMRSATTTWLQFWVQLDTPTQVAAYRQFLIDYSAQQKSLGRFQRPATNARLYSLMGWLVHENLVPGDVRLQMWLALGFLLVCMVNVMALLLAKFLRRSGEISVRRALGARRRDIFVQFGIESAVIGVAGGVLGVLIAELGLWSVRHRPDDYAHIARMDASMLLTTLALAVFASMIAGLLPAWRACRVAPALQLKTL
ncbi:ABC transporter ATP-binding protein [Rhodanobacter sp. C06]|uniref:ABC transporter permease n=1 Tax=Rhodanobacter sp. C06 TaxID=1945854 RepID=UPI00098438DD|nr:ABC transporter permease [Rhodanobacter sp. C06]OOG36126.1 ABC transporter ATP-binding protein [Rhodanobacter sp. C06]OOG36161.1 ABC transporter ATP-binding protein [Rhodanobacter sp. C06]